MSSFLSISTTRLVALVSLQVVFLTMTQGVRLDASADVDVDVGDNCRGCPQECKHVSCGYYGDCKPISEGGKLRNKTPTGGCPVAGTWNCGGIPGQCYFTPAGAVGDPNTTKR